MNPAFAPVCTHTPSPRTPPPNTPLRKPVLAADLDGTLLTTAKRIHPLNQSAILHALQNGLTFLPATGKSPSGAFRAMDALGTHLLSRNHPQGVFLNGLLVRTNTRTIHQAFLPHPAVAKLVNLAKDHSLVPLFYAGDSVLVEQRSTATDMFLVSHEPTPTALGSFDNLPPVHKALLVTPGEQIALYRPLLERVLAGCASVTQARADVLEVMPCGVSKATGLRLLLAELGFEPGELVAVGDHENDLDMIAMAGVGVAVGNAVQGVKDVADEIVCTCDDGAVAEVLRRFVL